MNTEKRGIKNKLLTLYVLFKPETIKIRVLVFYFKYL